MMKKMSLRLIPAALLLLLLLLPACGKSEEPAAAPQPGTASTNAPTETAETLSPEETAEPIAAEEPTGTEENALLGYTFHVPGREIYVDVPEQFQEYEKGYTQIYFVSGIKYVSVTAERGEEFAGLTDLMEAHEAAFAKFLRNIQNVALVTELHVEEDETVTVNGLEVYRFTGTLGQEYSATDEAFVTGCSFVLDGTPCCLVGSVMTAEQEQSDIDEISDMIAAMMDSVRTEP